MEFLDNNQNNLNLQDSESVTVVASATETNRALERNNNIYTSKNKWTMEMKMELIKIETQERKNGRLFMERIKQRWDEKYPENGLTKQNLRDNSARFKKDRKLMNLLLVGEKDTDNGENENENVNDSLENYEQGNLRELGTEQDEYEIDGGEMNEIEIAEEDKSLYIKFRNYLNDINKVEENDFKGRNKLPKYPNFLQMKKKLKEYLQNIYK